MTIAGGGPVTLPSWFPSYPGSKPEGTASVQGTEGDAGAFSFSTTDAPAKVLQFYEEGLKGAGLEVTTLKNDAGGTVAGGTEGDARSAWVAVTTEGGATKVSATFKDKK